jgi:hypothetical protein
MEIHSYQGSLNPLWNSTARMGASEEPVSVTLPAVPSCDIKPGFFISFATPAWPQSGMGVQQAAAMEAVDSYGIPEQVQTDSVVE